MIQDLKRAKVKLILDHPFFASLLMNLNVEFDDNVSTACVSPTKMRMGTKFFKELSADERVFVLAHEVMHPALLHHTRMGDRDPMLWNMATDYVINQILTDNGLQMPKVGLLDSKYKDMHAEKIYEILKKNKQQKGGNDWKPGDGFAGSLGDFEPFQGSESESRGEEQNQIRRVIGAYQASKIAGKAPAGLERLIEDFLNPKVDWKTMLRQLISEKSFNDYMWRKPNPRYMGTGFYLPALEDETFGEVCIFIDTSGSITQQDLNEYASEINSIHEIFSNKVTVVYCDADVAGVDEFDADEELKFEIKGGGGTDFRPPFAWVDENGKDPKVVVYFTDGYCDSFPSKPEYDTIWCVNGSKDNFEPPFGEVVYID